MIKIGEFSKICGLSVKTLRFYDQAGLLPPAFIDEHSGYRYYTENQLLTVKRILSYKEQGFTLDQIKVLLNDISQHEAMERLKSKQTELLQTIQTTMKQLDEVNNSIHRIQHDLQKADRRQIRLRRVKPQLAASIRDVVPRSKVCVLIDEIIRYVQNESEEDAKGSISILWHDHRGGNRMDALVQHDPVDIEVAVPLSRPISGNDRVQVRQIPGMKAASFLHFCDPFAHHCPVMEELFSWVEARDGITFGEGAVRETYLTPDKDIYGRSRLAELLIPVV